MERKLLCIADDTKESKTAVLFAAKRAALNGSKLVILRIIEPVENSLLSAIHNEIIDDLRIEALDKLQNLAQLARQNSAVEAQILIREGQIAQEISNLIDEDKEIKTLFLAASASKSGQGPLLNAATRGALVLGKRKVGIMIIPAGLNDDELLELAG
jgi:nucleotide-binding universal stress UspA family protein